MLVTLYWYLHVGLLSCLQWGFWGIPQGILWKGSDMVVHTSFTFLLFARSKTGAVKASERLKGASSPNGGARRNVLESISPFYELFYKVWVQ